MENKPIEKKFSFLKRAEGFVHAGRGIYIFIKSTHSFWIEFVVFIIAILVGLFFKITNTEWILVIIISGIVFISEAFNSAIEIDINLTSPLSSVRKRYQRCGCWSCTFVGFTRCCCRDYNISTIFFNFV